MRLSYDDEGDVLEIIFDERFQSTRKKAFRLRHGIVLYVANENTMPVQLTLVNYRALSQFPVVQFDGWRALSSSDKEQLLPILNSPSISAFLKIDPESGSGHLSSPDMLEILPVAA
ncbi:MAG: hypothetical protein ACE5I1_14855 [bacterium]